MSYKEELKEARLYAEKRIVEDYPEVRAIMDKMIEFFTMVTEKMEGVEFVEEKEQYKLLLMVSFMRTHCVINELVLNSEIIEAATLMRKQLELLARIKEIDVGELKKLNKRVPQVNHVPWMKEFYGLWSNVAHNASVDSLDLLGYNMDDENHKRCYVQPTYTENTIETLNMNIGLFMLFGLEVVEFMERILPIYKSIEEREFLLSFNEYGSKTNIPYFDSLKEKKDGVK